MRFASAMPFVACCMDCNLVFLNNYEAELICRENWLKVSKIQNLLHPSCLVLQTTDEFVRTRRAKIRVRAQE